MGKQNIGLLKYNPFCLSDGISSLRTAMLDHLSQSLGFRYNHLKLHLAASNSKLMSKASLTTPHKDPPNSSMTHHNI